MALNDYYQELMNDVNTQYETILNDDGKDHLFEEEVFTEYVLTRLQESDMIVGDGVCCHHECKIRNANIKVSGYALAFGENEDKQLDLFVSLYESLTTEIPNIQEVDVKKYAGQCFRFLDECRKGVISDKCEQSSDVYELAEIIKEVFKNFIQIRIFVLTNGKTKNVSLPAQQLENQEVSFEVINIERLYRYVYSGQPQDEILVNFVDYCGRSLPCVCMTDNNRDYDCFLCSIPGDVLFDIYKRYGDRLLEANVRSFLNTHGKVNKGIRETLRVNPLRFMAYNNGIVITANEIQQDNTDNKHLVTSLKGMQIVNGGQTVATIFFTKMKFPETDLSKVQVIAKILLLRLCNNPEEQLANFEEDFIANVSRYSNSQNAVRMADLSSNKQYHVELERLANTTYCPDGVTRWFYERSNGKYNVMIARESSTPSKRKEIQKKRPSSKKITKTDFAKYMFSWDQKPFIVSLGSQKNFEQFMLEIEKSEKETQCVVNQAFFKESIAKAILFKTATKSATKDKVPAFRANVICYLVAMIAKQYGDCINWDMIWKNQDLSRPFSEQLSIWSQHVYSCLVKTSNKQMVSEWAKKSECWEKMQDFPLPKPDYTIPEFRKRVK